MSDESSAPVITASEISQHAHCARSWPLGRVKGDSSAHVREIGGGRAANRAHAHIVLRRRHLQRLAYALLLLAVLLGVRGLDLVARGL
jgi:hypothetical protein